MSSSALNEDPFCAKTQKSAATQTIMTEKGRHRMKGNIFITLIIMSSRKIPTIIMSNRKIQSTATSAQTEESLEPDLNYASLDLKVANKYKKNHRHQQGHTQGRNKPQDQLPVHHTPSVNAFLEVEADMDAHLPSRDTGTMVSHSSIYLNSQQIAEETEEMEREWGIDMERVTAGWEGIRRREDGGSREWKGEQESEERKGRQDISNGSVCTQLSEIDAIQSGTDHFINSFSHDSVPQA
ncbi:uncharacterized protein LOC123962861 isoform X2 [Micropterus dolomieu]|uniref:uncharacterized protein LOC123962861 isoform X2 n=1 Tax=Micropterus dolomieu TaxID=147949 RepID=UPI001E8D9911|nr:uncharacterized protein LOC123962861 isoform X2 [Micropterus dolomieu]